MSFSVIQRPGVRVCAWIPTLVFLLQLGGCYTRQIEGIQSDLDDLDRKIHSIHTKAAKGSPSESDGGMKTLEDDLNQTRLQQAALRDDLTHIQQQLAEALDQSKSAGPGGSGSGTASSGDLNQIRKDLQKNQEQTDRLTREMSEVQKTFGTLKTETRALLELLQSEYGTEAGGGNDLLSSAGPSPLSSTTQFEGPGPTGGPTASSDVKVGRTHRVTPGENLTSIAGKYRVSLEDLKEINGIEDPNDLRMGQEIYIP